MEQVFVLFIGLGPDKKSLKWDLSWRMFRRNFWEYDRTPQCGVYNQKRSSLGHSREREREREKEKRERDTRVIAFFRNAQALTAQTELWGRIQARSQSYKELSASNLLYAEIWPITSITWPFLSSVIGQIPGIFYRIGSRNQPCKNRTPFNM